MKQMAFILTSASNISFARKLVSEGKWFGRKTVLAGKLVWQGHSISRENYLAGNLVWQRN